MAQKKKQRKPMSPQAKRNLGNVFKSIISNQAAIDGAKEAPLFIAIIFFLISLVLPLIPIMTTVGGYYGASFVATYNYTADQGLRKTSTDLVADGFEFKIDNGQMSFYQNGGLYDFDTEDNLVASHTLKDGEKEYYNFMFYITNKTGDSLVNYVKELSAKQYESGTLNPRDAAKEEIYITNETTFYTPSFIVLAKETMGVQLFKYDSTTAVAASYGGLDWFKSPQGDLLKRVTAYDETSGKTETEAIFENWKQVFNETYEDQKTKDFWTQVGIYAGVYAGLIIFMGLMIFILTRGKNNPNRTINFFVAQKIAWWEAFTPSVLGMVLAFIMPGNVIGQMGFIIFLSLRTMWLSMRQLRPMQ